MEAALAILLAIGSGIAGFATGGRVGFAGGALLGSLITTCYVVDAEVRQGTLTLEQAEALGQVFGQQIGEALPGLKQFISGWEVTEETQDGEGEAIGANRFVRGVVQELCNRD